MPPPSDIKRLLSKKSWTGQEVGRAVLQSFIHDYENRAKPKYAPLFTQEQLDQMVLGLKNDRERRVYAQYVSLYNGLLEEYNRSQAHYQQAQNGFYRLSTQLAAATQAERAAHIAERIPALLTQAQYDRTAAQRAREKRAIEESYRRLVFHALEYYLGGFSGKKPKLPEPVRDAFAALKTQPFTNQDILAHINRDYGRGYYLLPDGRRSDQMTPVDFEAALALLPPFSDARLAELDALPSELTAAGPDSTTVRRSLREVSDLYRALWQGNPPAPTLDFITEDEPPAGLTAWDVLGGDWQMRHRYRAARPDQQGEGRRWFEAFCADFPEVYRALREDLLAQPGLSLLLPERPDPMATITTWGPLADLGLYAYPTICLPDPPLGMALTPYGPRGHAGGIAVLRPGTCPPDSLDGEGGFIDPTAELLGLLPGLSEMAGDSALGRELQDARQLLLLPALRWLEAFNATLSLLAEAYGMKALLLQCDLGPLRVQISSLNQCLFLCYLMVTGDSELRAQKRETLRALLPPLPLNQLAPAPDAIEQLRARIAKPETFETESLQSLVFHLAQSAWEVGT